MSSTATSEMRTDDDDRKLYEFREKRVDNAFDHIDNLSGNAARSILRWLVTNEEEFEGPKRDRIFGTVILTSLNSDFDLDGVNALLEFSDTASAKSQWRQTQGVEMSRADEEETNETMQDAEAEDQTSGALVTADSDTEDGNRDTLAYSWFGTPRPNIGLDAFENVQSTRSDRDGQFTANDFFGNTAPSSQPQAKPERVLCRLCNNWYLEEDNVLQDNGKPPCGYHTGQIIDYGRFSRGLYGVRRTDEAWNCCRRGPRSAGCHPTFHERSE